MNNLIIPRVALRSGFALLLLSSVAACSGGRVSGGLAPSDQAAVGSGSGSASTAGGTGTSGSAGGASGSGMVTASADGTSTGSDSTGIGATGATGPAGPTGPAGAPGASATLLGGALSGTVDANAGGLQAGGASPSGSSAALSVAALGPTAANPGSPVSASLLSGSGNQAQGLLTGLTTATSSSANLRDSLSATAEPVLGVSGTLPVVSQLQGGILPTAPMGTSPLIGANANNAAILGNGQTPSLVNAAALSSAPVAGSPVTANVLNGGSVGALTGGATGALTSGSLANTGGGAVAPVTNVVGGVTSGVTGGVRSGAVSGLLTPVAGTVNGLTGGVLRR